MTHISISKQQAKQFLVDYHYLSKKSLKGKEGLLTFVNQAGCLQYDPLNVVGRNPDLVLQSRLKNYRSHLLHQALYEDRTLVDGWDKMMAIHLSEEFPHLTRIRQAHVIETEQVMAYRKMTQALEVVEDVYKALEANGPLMSKDLDMGKKSSGRWGHSKLSSVALDYLFHQGRVGVYNKNNTQKSYDLIERLLPEHLHLTEDPFEDELTFKKWYVLRRIKSMGLLWEKNGGAWLGHFVQKKNDRLPIIHALEAEGRIVKVYVDGISDGFYVLKENLEQLLATKVNPNKQMRFLAPLDNFMWDRDLIEVIFDFNYRWEVYVPEAKRQYGYYVLPVLYGNNLIARFEPDLYRGELTWSIKNWWWQDKVRYSKKLEKALQKAIKEFSHYLGADHLDQASYERIERSFHEKS